jgi:glycosyltransferase involved in cell wall biosynthesis
MGVQTTKKKILFLSHDASRTGAPILLLNLLRWLKENSDLSFQVLLRDGGVLEPEFSALASVSNLKSEMIAYTGWIPRGSGRIGLRKTAEKICLARLKARLRREDFGLVYANTVTNGDLLDYLSDLRCQVLCHVHELEYGIHYVTDTQKFERLKAHTDHFIAASESVRQNLVTHHGIPADKVSTVHSFISVSSSQELNQKEARSKVLERLSIPANASIVAASGALEWHKGPDVFIQLALSLRPKQRTIPVHFLWVGGESKGPRFEQMMYDARNAGVEEYVHFVGSQPDPLNYFAACDVFAMVSREDSFPLVSLEAASLDKPIVCFDGSGGAKEFVEDDCGYVVPYLDVESMSHRVEELLNSVELRRRFGHRAEEKVRQRHDVSVAASKILSIIRQLLQSN